MVSAYLVQLPSPPGRSVFREWAGGMGTSLASRRTQAGHGTGYCDIPFSAPLYVARVAEQEGVAFRYVDGQATEAFDEAAFLADLARDRHVALASNVLRLPIPSARIAAANKDRAAPDQLFDGQVLIGRPDHIVNQAWACPAHLFRSVPYADLYPTYIGGDDALASAHWAALGIPMGYLENGPVARHLDWPYSEEKIALYQQLTQARVGTDLSYIWWKIRRFFR